MAKETKHGGKRTGAGRPPLPKKSPKKKSYSVSLYEKDKKAIVKEHGSLTKAIETTLPSKTTPKRK